MTDRTILKPTPGGRKSAKPINAALKDAISNEPVEDKTVMAAVAASPSLMQRKQQVLISDNPLIEEAGDLFSLIGPIRSTTSHPDVMGFKAHCINLIKQYETRLNSRGVSAEEIKHACYCLCSFIDESVLNTNWGSDSEWASLSLLSNFYQETFGGEYFYTLLEHSLGEPKQNIQLIELMYLCLSFGFVGKMRLQEQGYERLNLIKERAYKAIKSVKGEATSQLSADWQSSVVALERSHAAFPIWVISVFVASLLLAGYVYASYAINQKSDLLNRNLINLVPLPEQSIVALSVNNKVTGEYKRLVMLLQTEIERNLIEVLEMQDRVRIRVGNDQLFSSGSASISESFLPVVQKIARSLEGADGRILVNGYTDDMPIFSTRFPSNWHLSLARANSVADTLAAGADLHGRLWPEGRGEVDAIVPNDSQANRARNRRVEIDLLPN